MFEVAKVYGDKYYIIDDDIDHYLHSDGSVYSVCEYFPNKRVAQQVLDKYQPKHEWKHGDVFLHWNGKAKMMYLKFSMLDSYVVCLDIDGPILYDCPGTFGNVEACLKDAKFLFNIKEKI